MGSRTSPVTSTVAIPTFHRTAELAGLLHLLPSQRAVCPDGFDIDVLVVDNDPDGSARAVVEACAGLGLGVRYVVEPEPGISAVRNRALSECADRRLVCFIDDDEIPGERWLAALLEQWRASGEPAAVSGRIVPEYAVPVDPWLEAGGFFVRRALPSGAPIDVAASGNLLLDLEQVRDHGLAFDPRFGLSGGEDTLFTRQLHRAGGRMVWCAESIAVDRVPPERLTRAWVLERARSHGNSTGLVALVLAETPATRRRVRAQLLVGGVVRTVVGSVRALGGRAVGSQRRHARGSRLAHRGRGMLAAAVGEHIQEYARPADDAGPV